MVMIIVKIILPFVLYSLFYGSSIHSQTSALPTSTAERGELTLCAYVSVSIEQTFDQLSMLLLFQRWSCCCFCGRCWCWRGCGEACTWSTVSSGCWFSSASVTFSWWVADEAVCVVDEAGWLMRQGDWWGRVWVIDEVGCGGLMRQCAWLMRQCGWLMRQGDWWGRVWVVDEAGCGWLMRQGD